MEHNSPEIKLCTETSEECINHPDLCRTVCAITLECSNPVMLKNYPEALDWWKSLSVNERQNIRWLLGNPLDGFMSDYNLLEAYERTKSDFAKNMVPSNLLEGGYKVGARVKIISCISGHEYEIGEIVTIIESEGDHWKCTNQDGVNWYIGVHECELLPITPQPMLQNDTSYNEVIQAGKGMVWVKASERTSPHQIDVNIKAKGMPFSGIFYKHDSGEASKDHYILAGKTVIYRERFFEIEWLDENKEEASKRQPVEGVVERFNDFKLRHPDYTELDLYCAGHQLAASHSERVFTLEEMKDAIRFGADRANVFCGFPSELETYLTEVEPNYFKEKFNINL